MSVLLLPYQERIRAAMAQRHVLAIRGMGSKDFLGPPCVLAEHLDTTGLSGIISYEPSELVITAYAGTPLLEIEQALTQHGQCLPFDAPHFMLNPLTIKAFNEAYFRNHDSHRFYSKLSQNLGGRKRVHS